MSIMWICPECGAIKIGDAGDICGSCNCQVIDTNLHCIEYIKMSDSDKEKWKQEIIKKYASHVTEEARTKRTKYEYEQDHALRCPVCGSKLVGLITGPITSYKWALETGHNSNTAGKTYHCHNCGHNW